MEMVVWKRWRVVGGGGGGMGERWKVVGDGGMGERWRIVHEYLITE